MMKKILSFAVLSMGFVVLGSGGSGGCGSAGTSAQVTLTVTGSGSGSVTSDSGGIDCRKADGSCSATFTAGTSVTFTAAPETGFVFNRWRGADCFRGRACTVTLTADTALEASFIPLVYKSNRALDGTAALQAGGVRNLWVTTTDGATQSALTRFTQATSDEPSFSPDGERIVYSSSRNTADFSDGAAQGNTNIWIQNADGSGDSVAVTANTAIGVLSISPQWTPDGEKIVYVSTRNLDDTSVGAPTNVRMNLWISGADGSAPTPLTRLTQSSSASATTPAVSPDGTKIVFVSTMALSGDPAGAAIGENVWVVNIDGTGLTPLTFFIDVNMRNLMPVWSPDGTRIVFTSYAYPLDLSPAQAAIGNANIWVMNADGSDRTPFTVKVDGDTDSYEPSWSADGSFLVFTSELNLTDITGPQNASNIWRVDADGSDLRPLTSLTNATNRGVALAPDDSFIFFDGTRDPADPANDAQDPNFTFNIFRVDVDGDNAFAITDLSVSGVESLTAYGSGT